MCINIKVLEDFYGHFNVSDFKTYILDEWFAYLRKRKHHVSRIIRAGMNGVDLLQSWKTCREHLKISKQQFRFQLI